MSIQGFAVTASAVLANRVEVVGNLSGTAPGGPYKIPLRIVYPTGPSPILRRAVVETWNSVLAETFGLKGAVIFDLGYQLLTMPFLVEQLGYTYVGHEWNKHLVDAQVASNFSSPHTAQMFFGAQPVPFDAGWKISAGSDGYTIMADVSKFARNPLAIDPFASLPPPPACDKAFGYGFSQTGTHMRGFAALGKNSAFGAGLPNGLVYEGILAANCGAEIRELVDGGAGYFRYGFHDGATPASEGPFINLTSETDLFLMEAVRARDAAAPAHYAFYEMAGIAHISADVGTFVQAIHNDTPQGPVHRAMIENLRAKVDAGTAFPPPQTMDGAVTARSAPLFGNTSVWTGLPFWGGFTANTFIGVPSDDDGNLQGGIRLPHLRTKLPDGESVGAPLGTYRGVISLNESVPGNTAPDAIKSSPVPLGFILGSEIYLMNSGFVSAWEPALLAERYRDAGEYTTFVAQAADYALAQRWILPADRDAYVAAAAKMTLANIVDCGTRRQVAPPAPPPPAHA